MLTALDLVTVPFAIFIALPATYLGFLAAVTLRRATVKYRNGGPSGTTRFAILVPAHDEEILIGRTVAGLLRLRYPPQRFSVHVVADNSSDETAAVARRNGGCVHERKDPSKAGKGAALNWLVDEVATEIPDIDAFVIVDADSALSANFLSAMERELRSGAQVVQALNLVAVPEDRPLVRIRELAFELTCHLRPLAYEILGGSSTLHGNGMCFAAPLCRRYRWSEASVVEDGELFLRLVSDGHRVALASDATVRSRMPATLREARSQALRWERGRFDHSVYALGLAYRGLRRQDPRALLAGLNALIPPIAVLATASFVGLVTGTATGAPALAALGFGSLLSLLFYALRGAALGRMAPRILLRMLVWVLPYAVWKLWVIALAAVGVGRGAWSRTSRAA